MRMPKREGREVLPTNNLFAIIVIFFIINSLLAGYLTYQRSQRIMQELTGEVVTTEGQARVCINKQPSINQSCNTTATVGAGYYCDADATDPDNDTITFYDDTALFSIDPSTGEIIFTPGAGDAGNHTITLTASDGRGCSNSNATSTFNLNIPGVPGVPSAGGGGGGGGAGPPRECTPLWECTPWSICRSDGARTRTCYTLNNCPKDRPEEMQNCIYLLPPVAPRPKFKEFYLCNFDEKDECFASFGMMEDWVYTYKAEDSTINILGLSEEGADVSIDDTIFFFAGTARIKPVDVTGDGIEDFEYILHRIYGGRAEMTVRLVKQVEVVVEKPVYIERLPVWMVLILMFVYENACIILLIVMIMAALLIYAGIMHKAEKEEQKKK
ncbi:hypothetical protein KY359_02325 [Candidatus Woesearchaeota archaeon]|nr:hypothetical protein [Candidatus Woesearchaeota archaeon]